MDEVWSYEDYDDKYEELAVPEGVPRMPEGNDPHQPEKFGVMKIVKLKSSDGDGHSMIIVLPLGIKVYIDHRDTEANKIISIVTLAREVVYFRQLQQEASGIRTQVHIERLQNIERLGIAGNLLEHETAFTDFLRLQQENLAASIQTVERSYKEITEQIIDRLRTLKELGMFHIDSPAGYFDMFTLSDYEELLASLNREER
ncbi:MAG: hypothetical protein Q7R81_07525 [Candidatus Peregrinibacteria bacterium]|nr:hypothetical protein [Candidatus Peregrinibacteria bacterium]